MWYQISQKRPQVPIWKTTAGSHRQWSPVPKELAFIVIFSESKQVFAWQTFCSCLQSSANGVGRDRHDECTTPLHDQQTLSQYLIGNLFIILVRAFVRETVHVSARVLVTTINPMQFPANNVVGIERADFRSCVGIHVGVLGSAD